ncbi:MAG: non-ribosomal peptide synthetase [Alphaproteobacteria bacterium]|nr:non-ribosomal peptide synthetase [Alphaproteobacteria bacterium]
MKIYNTINDFFVTTEFEKQVNKNPESIALTYDGKELTYASLNDKANQLAKYLHELGVRSESVVGIGLERSFDLIISILAVLKTGGAYVPLDPNYPEDRLKYILSDSGAKILLTHSSVFSNVSFFSGMPILLDNVLLKIESYSSDNFEIKRDLNHLAYVIYTSGSTGQPKGVAIEQRSLGSYINWCIEQYPCNGTVLLHSSVAFDMAITNIFPPLLSGGKIVILPENKRLENLQRDNICRDKLNFLKLTPSHLMALSRLEDKNNFFNSVDTLILGGEALLHDHLIKCFEANKNLKVINEYGPTEATVGCGTFQIDCLNSTHGAVPIGEPIQNMKLYILDKYYRQIPNGVVGELYIAGVGLARGYLNRPDLTAEKFIPDPFNDEPGARLYRTGDLARYLPDGNMEYVGRIDHQVKIRGYRIELGEIESVLRKHPDINDAVVIDSQENDYKILVAYLIRKEEISNENEKEFIDQIRSFLKKCLPEYMIPTYFMTIPKLPLNHTGKIDRKALPAFGKDQRQIEITGQVPLTETEKKLISIWSEVLNVEKISPHDDFFSLGGHSLLGIQLISKINEELGIDMELADIFEFSGFLEFFRVLEDYKKKMKKGA